MPAKLHHVTLTSEQRAHVEIIARSYKHSERERNRARILLLADASTGQPALKDADISAQVGVCQPTVEQVRRRFAEGGVDAAMFRKEQAHRKVRLLDGAAEAFLVATTCSAPPEGQKRWSLHLLQDKMIAAGYCESVSHETIRQTLKKMNSSPG